LVLRKKDRREWAWFAIPGIVVVFTVGLFLYGMTVKGNKPLMSMLSFVNARTEGATDITTYTGIALAKRGDYSFRSGDNGLFRYIGQSGEYRNYYYDEYSMQPRVVTASIRDDNGMAVERNNLNVWNMYCFEEKRMRDSVGTLTADLYAEPGYVRGTVRNNTNQLLTEVLIVVNNQFCVIDSLEAGATSPVEIKLMQNQGGYFNYYMILDQMYPYYYVGMPMQDARSADQRKEDNLRRDIQSSYFDQMNMYGYGYGMQPVPNVLLGWAQDPVTGSSMLVNGSADAIRFARTVFEGQVDIHYEKDGKLFVPFDVKTAEFVNNGNSNVYADPYGINIQAGEALLFIEVSEWSKYDIEALDVYWPIMYGNNNVTLSYYAGPLLDEWNNLDSLAMMQAQWTEMPMRITGAEFSLPKDVIKAMSQHGLWFKASLSEAAAFKEGTNLGYPTIQIKGTAK